MSYSNLGTTPLKTIVLNDFRAGAILDRYRLDYCCGGTLTLAESCRQRGISVARVIAEIVALDPASSEVATDDPVALIAHIVQRHHAYVRDAIPLIRQHLAKVVAAHGDRHTELAMMDLTFVTLADELLHHLMKEEKVLFPYIASLHTAVHLGGPHPVDTFGTVQNPIRMMETEHQEAADEMEAIRSLCHDYVVPVDACSTYRLVLEELQAFERDLHTHVHLENHVLFPRAVELEERAMAVRVR